MSDVTRGGEVTQLLPPVGDADKHWLTGWPMATRDYDSLKHGINH